MDRFITLYITDKWVDGQPVFKPMTFHVAHITAFTPLDDGRTYLYTQTGGHIVRESFQEVCNKIHG